MASRDTRNRMTATALWVFVAGMVGLSFASVPLYQLFCDVTGYGGQPKTDVAAGPSEISEKTITVRFDSNINPNLPWRFKPVQRQVTVRLGEERLAFYQAKNLSKGDATGTALFNVTPFKAGQYFSKIDCFCFTEQTLTAEQVADMPVQFFVDPEILNDPNTRDLKTITLSYTFYKTEPDEAPSDAPKTAARDDTQLNKPEKG